MKITFVFSHSGLVRHLQGVVKLAAKAGHDVSIIIAKQKKGLRFRSMDELQEMPNVKVVKHTKSSALGSSFLGVLRRIIDCTIYLRPNHPSPVLMKRYSKRLFKIFFVLLEVSFIRSTLSGTRFQRFLRSIEQWFPGSGKVGKILDSLQPDVVVTSPFLFPDSDDIEYLKVANSKKIPTCSIITSWDNLSTKGTAHVPVNKLFIWNQALKREAELLHGINPSVLEVVGAPTFDHLFEWKPTISRQEFCNNIGLSENKKIILYLCSSGSISSDETVAIFKFARELEVNPTTRDAILIARPHPLNFKIWENIEELPKNVMVYPRAGDLPDNDDSIDTFSHSIHHSDLVVGLNTSSFLEASILNRPSLSLPSVKDCYEPHRFGHFQHLVNGKFILTPHTMEKAAALTGTILNGNDPCKEKRLQFVNDFIRPCGRETEASAVMLNQIETVAAARERTLPMRKFVNLPNFQSNEPIWEGVQNRKVVVYTLLGLAHFPYHESVIEALCEAGHQVHLAVLKYSTKRAFFMSETVDDQANELMDNVRKLIARYPNFSFVNISKSELVVPDKTEKIRFLRSYASYVRRFPKSNYYRTRWHGYMPHSLQRLCSFSLVTGLLKHTFVENLLGKYDQNTPPVKAIVERLTGLKADLVIASPGNMRSNLESEWLKAASYLNIKTAVVTLSWDNLTTKGLLHIKPDYLFAWNRSHAEAARNIHKIPRKSIVISGSPFFDKWKDSSTFMQEDAEFKKSIGLDPDKPYLVYLGSSKNIAKNESWLVREIYRELSQSEDPLVKDLQILVRPHPGNRGICEDLSDLPVILAGDEDIGIPYSFERKKLLFNTLHHSSMTISLNTSAIIDAIALDKPCLSVKTDRYSDTHINSAHFGELLKAEAVVLADNVGHCAKIISEHLHGADPSFDKRQTFKRDYILSPNPEKNAGETIAEFVTNILNTAGKYGKQGLDIQKKDTAEKQGRPVNLGLRTSRN